MDWYEKKIKWEIVDECQMIIQFLQSYCQLEVNHSTEEVQLLSLQALADREINQFAGFEESMTYYLKLAGDITRYIAECASPQDETCSLMIEGNIKSAEASNAGTTQAPVQYF